VPASALLTALSGLALGLSLIVAIGSQNAFVLRQGLLGRHVLPVVAVCAASDAVLISAGTYGAGALLERLPWLELVMRLLGAAFLLGYGLLAARRALRPASLEAGTPESAGLGATLLTTLALTWLNPHVYLDTVVLLGAIANGYGDQRWWFAGGAVLAGLVWFTSLGFGARLLRPLFARPASWRVLDAVIAVVMTALAVSLLLGA
jgi:L-lysine exporter family protein LysE/ArgO